MKYVVFRVDGEFPIEIPVVFPHLLVHASVAERIQPMLQEVFGKEVATVSAGEVSLFDVDCSCCGESTTLRLKSRGAIDDHLLSMNDYGSGVGAV